MAFKPIFRFRNPDSTSDLNSAYSSAIPKGIYSGGDITVSTSNLNITVAPFTAVGFDGLVVKTDAPVVLTAVNGIVNVVALFAKYQKPGDPVLQLSIINETSLVSSSQADFYVVFGKVDLTAGGYNGLLLEAAGSPPVNKAYFSFAESHFADKLGTLKSSVPNVFSLPSTKNRKGDVRYAVAENALYAWNHTTKTWNNILATAAPFVTYNGGDVWADGTTNPASTVQTQLDKIILDLGGGTPRTGTGDSFSFITPIVTLNDATGNFLTEEVGGYITITGATTPANNGTFQILSRPTATSITYSNSSGVAEAFTGTWSIVRPGGSNRISTDYISGSPVANPYNSTLQDSLEIIIAALNNRAVLGDANAWTNINTFSAFTRLRGGVYIEELPVSGTLSGTVDNYTITGLDRASVVRFSTSSSTTLTGLDSPNIISYEVPRKTLYNLGTFPIVIKNEGVSSSSGNQFLTPGKIDYILYPNDSVEILYDTGLSKWLLVEKLHSTKEITATITSGTTLHNYNPTGWSTASIVRLISSAGVSVNTDITGFSSTDVQVKRKTIIFFASSVTNASSVPTGERVTLKNSNSGSSSTSQIRTNLNFTDYVLQHRDTIDIVYDETNSIWRVVPNSVSRYDNYKWLGKHRFEPVTAATEGLYSLGNTTGPGIYAVGGSSDGTGVLGEGGGTNGRGGTFTGKGTGYGIYAVGGNSASVNDDSAAIYATGGTGGSIAGYFVGTLTRTGVYGEGGSTSGTGVRGKGGLPNGKGGLFEGQGTAVGLEVTGGSSATTFGTNGAGVYTTGGGVGVGIYAVGGESTVSNASGAGIYAIGGAGSIGGVGGYFVGTQVRSGAYGKGGSTSTASITGGRGLRGEGGDSTGTAGIGGIGVHGEGGQATNTGGVGGYGVYGKGGVASGTGVYGEGGSTNGIGVFGNGTGTGAGGYFVGGSDGHGVYGDGLGTGNGGHFEAGSTGRGVYAVGGATLAVSESDQVGVYGKGGTNGSSGGYFEGTEGKAGVVGRGTAGPTANGIGGLFYGGSDGSHNGREGIYAIGGDAADGYNGGSGVIGDGANATGFSGDGGIGVRGRAGKNGSLGGNFGIGVLGEARSGITNAIGVKGIGEGTGYGGYFEGGSASLFVESSAGIGISVNGHSAGIIIGDVSNTSIYGQLCFNTTPSHTPSGIPGFLSIWWDGTNLKYKIGSSGTVGNII